MEMRNADETTLECILVMRTNFVSEISVWHEQSGTVMQVLEQELSSPFSSRPIDYHQLATALKRPLQTEEAQRCQLSSQVFDHV